MPPLLCVYNSGWTYVSLVNLLTLGSGPVAEKLLTACASEVSRQPSGVRPLRVRDVGRGVVGLYPERSVVLARVSGWLLLVVAVSY